MIFLRGNTASQEVPLGYFVDSTDGNTEETGLTIANTDIKIWKSGATTLANKNSGGATHISNGVYYAVLDATDTNTYGPLKIFVHVSGALACALECSVLPEVVYDSFFPASAGAPLPIFGIVDWGTAQTSAAGTLVHRSGLSLANDIINGATELVYAGTGAGQSRLVNDFVGATDTSSISPNWVTTPSTDSLYVTLRTPPPSTSTDAIPTLAQLNTTRYAKNTASQKVYFTLVDSSDHVTRETGITVTAQRSLDGAAFGSATGTVTEVGNGVYYLAASAADTNADDVVFRFTGTGCDPVELHIVTAS